MRAAPPASLQRLEDEVLDNVTGGLTIPSPLPWEWPWGKPQGAEVPITVKDPRPPRKPG